MAHGVLRVAMTKPFTLMLLLCGAVACRPSSPCGPEAPAWGSEGDAPVRLRAGSDFSTLKPCGPTCAQSACPAGASCGYVYIETCSAGPVCVPEGVFECADGGRPVHFESCPAQFFCHR